jgi:hypothetical protein
MKRPRFEGVEIPFALQRADKSTPDWESIRNIDILTQPPPFSLEHTVIGQPEKLALSKIADFLWIRNDATRRQS